MGTSTAEESPGHGPAWWGELRPSSEPLHRLLPGEPRMGAPATTIRMGPSDSAGDRAPSPTANHASSYKAVAATLSITNTFSGNHYEDGFIEDTFT